MRIDEALPSKVELIPDFISAAIEKLYHLPLDEHVIFQIKLSLQEAVVNAVKHGNKLNPDLFVQVVIEAEKSSVTIRVTDQGTGFDVKKVPNPTRPENIIKLQGRGIFLIRNLMDDVRFLDGGRTIKMIKNLKRERRVKMQMQLEKVNEVTVVVLEGEINVTNSNELRNQFIKITQTGCKKVVVDFVKVTFIDSSGLATLIEMFQRLEGSAGKLRLCNVNKKIRGIFEITKVHKLISIFDSREDALKDL
jgi:serine/threonine-protein kinase RsbW